VRHLAAQPKSISRSSLGAANTEADVDRVIAALPGMVEKLRSLTRSPGSGLRAPAGTKP
jgi:cysteine sulfinate desulfinase/cysteine desulfurase-like protein